MRIDSYLDKHIYIYIYMYICTYVYSQCFSRYYVDLYVGCAEILEYIAVWRITDKDDLLITPLLDLICLVLLCHCFCKDESK